MTRTTSSGSLVLRMPTAPSTARRRGPFEDWIAAASHSLRGRWMLKDSWNCSGKITKLPRGLATKRMLAARRGPRDSVSPSLRSVTSTPPGECLRQCDICPRPPRQVQRVVLVEPAKLVHFVAFEHDACIVADQVAGIEGAGETDQVSVGVVDNNRGLSPLQLDLVRSPLAAAGVSAMVILILHGYARRDPMFLCADAVSSLEGVRKQRCQCDRCVDIAPPERAFDGYTLRRSRVRCRPRDRHVDQLRSRSQQWRPAQYPDCRRPSDR
jgi:hypothetical protein